MSNPSSFFREESPSPGSNPVRDTFQRMLDESEVVYEHSGVEGLLRARFSLTGVDVAVTFCGEPDFTGALIVSYPVRVAPEVRPLVGEFLLRANYAATRSLWEMDYEDGEVRLRWSLETSLGPLTVEHARALLGFVLHLAEAFFPFLIAVMSRAMKPDFALDQALAAYRARLGDGTGDDELE